MISLCAGQEHYNASDENAKLARARCDFRITDDAEVDGDKLVSGNLWSSRPSELENKKALIAFSGLHGSTHLEH